jgi:hypothetical protein
MVKLAQIIGFSVLAVTTCFILVYYNTLPPTVPLYFTSAGLPIDYAPKSQIWDRVIICLTIYIPAVLVANKRTDTDNLDMTIMNSGGSWVVASLICEQAIEIRTKIEVALGRAHGIDSRIQSSFFFLILFLIVFVHALAYLYLKYKRKQLLNPECG